MTCQPLRVILCCLPEKGREIEEIAEEMKERDRGERGKRMNVKKQKKKKNIPPLPLPAARIAGLAQLKAKLSLTPG